MKIWLDDERDPTKRIIQSQFGSEGDEVWAKSAPVAINYLKQGRCTFISLDHDLGAGAGSGMDVAKWIEEQAYHGTLTRLTWTIHSMNAVGRKNMEKALFNADKYWSIHEAIKNPA
jgi:hypothetical protein